MKEVIAVNEYNNIVEILNKTAQDLIDSHSVFDKKEGSGEYRFETLFPYENIFNVPVSADEFSKVDQAIKNDLQAVNQQNSTAMPQTVCKINLKEYDLSIFQKLVKILGESEAITNEIRNGFVNADTYVIDTNHIPNAGYFIKISY